MDSDQIPQGMGCKTVLFLIITGFVAAAVIFVVGWALWGDRGSYYLFLGILFLLILFFITYFIKTKRKASDNP